MVRRLDRRERMLEVLREIVELHIETGAPVGSKAIAQRLREQPSSATVRAVMAELDEQGLLAQPHTSSGRVPTDRGYRIYLDELLRPGRVAPADQRSVAGFGWAEGATFRDLLRDAARLLAQRMSLAGLIAGPLLESAVLHHIEFVWLRRGSVVALVVTGGGIVHERLLRVDDGVAREDLEKLSNYLMSFLPGLTLVEVRARIQAELACERAALGELEARALELGRRALADAEGGEVVVDGTAAVLEYQEFAEPGRAAGLVRSIHERETWLEILGEVAQAEDIKVFVGAEARRPSLDECAIVVSSYHAVGGEGLVAVVGPKRLDYRRAIPLVGLVASRLSEVLGSADPGESGVRPH